MLLKWKFKSLHLLETRWPVLKWRQASTIIFTIFPFFLLRLLLPCHFPSCLLLFFLIRKISSWSSSRCLWKKLQTCCNNQFCFSLLYICLLWHLNDKVKLSKAHLGTLCTEFIVRTLKIRWIVLETCCSCCTICYIKKKSSCSFWVAYNGSNYTLSFTKVHVDKNLINVKYTKVINWESFVRVDFLFDLQTQNQNENIKKHSFQVNYFSDSRSVSRFGREKS